MSWHITPLPHIYTYMCVRVRVWFVCVFVCVWPETLCDNIQWIVAIGRNFFLF